MKDAGDVDEGIEAGLDGFTLDAVGGVAAPCGGDDAMHVELRGLSGPPEGVGDVGGKRGAIGGVMVGAFVGAGAPELDAVVGEALHVIGGDEIAEPIGVGIAPAHEVGVGGELVEGAIIPLAHHVVPEDGGDAAGVEFVEDGLDVMEVERAGAVLLDECFGVGVGAEVPSFVAAEVEVLDVGTEGEDIFDHAFNQVSRAGGEGVEILGAVGDFAE